MRLRKARRRAGLSQQELATALDKDRTLVSHVEGSKKFFSLEVVIEAARILETSVDYLVGLSADPAPPWLPTASRVTAPSTVRDLPGIRWVEVRGLAAAAGGGAAVLGEEIEGYLAFRRKWLANHGIDPTQCVVIDVTGDSMEPTLPEGSAILVDRAQRRRQAGRIYVIRGENGLLVKRALRQQQGWVMASDNSPHPSLPWQPDAQVIGEVRWMARSIR